MNYFINYDNILFLTSKPLRHKLSLLLKIKDLLEYSQLNQIQLNNIYYVPTIFRIQWGKQRQSRHSTWPQNYYNLAEE